MDNNRKTAISKFLSYVLRHNPNSIGIELDRDGWTKIDRLVSRVRERYAEFDEAVLREITQTDDKQRYAVSGGKIRAQQGHSIDVRAMGAAQSPPDFLYHGTTREKLAAIQKDGAIRPMSRQHVHLSTDMQTATQVASRRRDKDPVVLLIRAAAMHQSEHEFRLTENQVWLTKRVPIEFVEIATDDDRG